MLDDILVEILGFVMEGICGLFYSDKNTVKRKNKRRRKKKRKN